MSVAKFKINSGDYNGATSATVIINRDNGLISVRPYRQHRTYELLLSDIAQIIVERVIKAEVHEAKLRKRLKRLG